ncbi:hypothetical protein ACFLWA_09830 [Chloroflexota bacterium]
MRKLAFILLGLLLLLLSPMASAQSGGTVEGQVVNRTTDAPPVEAGVPVALMVVQGEAETIVAETLTDASGRYRFEGMDTDPGVSYWPEATYAGVTYSVAEPLRYDGGETVLEATLNVFETTDDDSTIRLNSVHLIAESFGEVLRISEIHLFGNGGDRTYVGVAGPGDPAVNTSLYIPLPEQAVGLAFQQGTDSDRFLEVEGGLQDTEPVPPGGESSLAFFSYHLMVPGDEVPLERDFAYPVDTLSMLVAQPGLALRSDQLVAMGPELFQGQQYEFYVSSDIASGEPVRMALLPGAIESDMGSGTAPSGTEAPAAAPSGQGNQELLRLLGFVLAGLAAAGVVVYLLIRRRSSDSPTERDLTTDSETRQLLAELADLEDDREAGKVDEATYERLRAEKREAIRTLWQ